MAYSLASSALRRQRDIELEDLLSSVKRDTAEHSRRHDRLARLGVAFTILFVAAVLVSSTFALFLRRLYGPHQLPSAAALLEPPAPPATAPATPLWFSCTGSNPPAPAFCAAPCPAAVSDSAVATAAL
eukprot:m51a1_g393 hypothetical protein (128) ;mRNA; r:701626-702085